MLDILFISIEKRLKSDRQLIERLSGWIDW